MTLPKPIVGLVIGYSFLWHSEHARGFDEGFKNRPCAIVVAVPKGATTEVMVLGITHAAPKQPDSAMELPSATKKRLGLDDKPSRIVTNEVNVFTWPGPDLRPRDSDNQASIAYGSLPADVLTELRRRVHHNALSGHIRVVPRTDI